MPFNAFTEGVPNPPNFPAIDVNTMLQNNNSINRIFSNAASPTLDNIGFNDNDGGFHNQVSMPDQAADPGLQGMDGVLFCRDVNGRSWPFWQNGIGSTFQLLGNSGANTINAAANGYTTLAGGIILQWGTRVNDATAAPTINFPIAFPTNCFMVTTSIITNNSAAQAMTGNPFNVGLTSFQFRNSTTAAINLGIYYVAIGN